METVKSPEGRVILRNVSWETYERLLDEKEERRVPQFFYDRGVLEIVSPSFEHEGIGYLIGLLVDLLSEERELDVVATAHTTFRHRDLSGGFEPDESFYFSENAERVRGRKRIDLDAGDPPPDLIVEVDITHPSLDKLPIYARLGVPEVWRHNGERLTILVLKSEYEYEGVTESTLLPPVSGEALTNLVREGLTARRPDWLRKVRDWTRSQHA